MIVQLDGLLSQYIDYPPLLGENGEVEFGRSVTLAWGASGPAGTNLINTDDWDSLSK